MLRIPSTVMGLTLVAAGVSVPDAVTSLKVIKEGKYLKLHIVNYTFLFLSPEVYSLIPN